MVVVTLSIPDEEVWSKFRKYVLRKYGALHSYLGREVAEALKYYLESRSSEEAKHPNTPQYIG
jgi:hypothetical protein